jgi:GGDEF domain-containing protein
MALQGPFVVVAESPAPDLVEALRAAGAFPIVESSWADAAAAIDSVQPEGFLLAEPSSDRKRAAALAQALAHRLESGNDPFIPVLARIRDDGAVSLPDALTIAASASAERIAQRFAAALRIRTLHSTVLRRTRTLAARGELPPELPHTDPLEEATVLVAGRGRSYPELAVAVGERAGLVGALSVETAARALNARDIDGMVIGDGFAGRVIEDARCDLPVAVLGGQANVVERFAEHLPNLERVTEGPARLVERILPFVRLHAFGERLKRMLKSLDAKGMIDPETGLLVHEAFWRDLNRAVDDADKRGVGLSIARFSFVRGDRRMSLDAARLLSRLMRHVDFACRTMDNSIFAVFTQTDLREAHVIARRIASVLKHTMLEPEQQRGSIETAITLATLKPTDNVDSLIARVVNEAAVG